MSAGTPEVQGTVLAAPKSLPRLQATLQYEAVCLPAKLDVQSAAEPISRLHMQVRRILHKVSGLRQCEGLVAELVQSKWSVVPLFTRLSFDCKLYQVARMLLMGLIVCTSLKASAAALQQQSVHHTLVARFQGLALTYSSW